MIQVGRFEKLFGENIGYIPDLIAEKSAIADYPEIWTPYSIRRTARAIYCRDRDAISSSLLLDQSPLNNGTRRAGEEGRCYSFDGVNDHVTSVTPLNVLSVTTPDSVTFMFKRTSTPASFEQVFSNYITSTNKFSIIIQTDGTVRIAHIDTAGKGVCSSTTNVCDNAWHRISATFDGINTGKIWIDGVEEFGVAGASSGTSAGWSMGSRIGATSYFGGQIFDFRIYNYELTETELNFIDTWGKNGQAPSDAAFWLKCDEQSGTTAYDSSGNGLTGTLTNITAATFHATQDIWSFQNQVGYNKRMYFDGAGVFINGSDSSLPSGTSAREIIFKILSKSTASISPLFLYGTESANQKIEILFNSNGNIGLGINGANIFKASSVNDGNQHLIRVVIPDSATLNDVEFYVDEVEITSTTSSANPTNSINTVLNEFIIGRNIPGTVFYQGLIYDLQILNSTSNIVYKLDGYGNTDADWTDQVGSNNGTVNGSPSNILLPRDESDPTNDVLGNPLTNIGRRPNDGKLNGSNCLTLNGTNQLVLFSDTGIDENIKKIWVRFYTASNITSASSPQILINFHNTSGYNLIGIHLGASTSSFLNEVITVFTSSTERVAVESITIPAGWNTLEVEWSGSDYLITLNGVSQTISTTGDNDRLNARTVVFGSDFNQTVRYYSGSLCDVKLYNDSDELIFHSPLSEGAGTSVYDVVGGRVGTIQNAATNWGVTQDIYHSNLIDGFVHAYQPAVQVYSGAQAANITSLSFKFRSTDNKLIVFNPTGALAWLLSIEDGGASTSLASNATYSLITIDNQSDWGTTRDDLHTALCDGSVHDVSISGIAFSFPYDTNGVSINGYSSWLWDSTTYLWDLVATDSGGNVLPVQNDPSVRLPAVTSSAGPYSIPLTNPAGDYHNNAETTIDFNPDSTPEMGATQLNSGVYQDAQQVFTKHQAANITSISFKFRSTDNQLLIFNDGNLQPYLFVVQSGSSSTDLGVFSGSFVISVDGSTGWGTTRGELQSAVCDGAVHDISISSLTLSSEFIINGIYLNSYTGFTWDSTTYLWNLVATDSNGDPIYPIPTVTSEALTVPSAHVFGSAIDSRTFPKQGFIRNRTTTDDRIVIMPDVVSDSALSTLNKYTQP